MTENNCDGRHVLIHKMKTLTQLLTDTEDFNGKFTKGEMEKCSLLQAQLQRILSSSVAKQRDDDDKNSRQSPTSKHSTTSEHSIDKKANIESGKKEPKLLEEPKEPAASSVDLDKLTQQAEEYVAADVRLFSSCADNEDIDDIDENNEKHNNRASIVVDDSLYEQFSLPDASERGGGVFTTAFLHLLHENHKQQGGAMSNREVLSHLVESLSTTGYTPHPILSCSRPHTIDEKFYIVPPDEGKNSSGTRRALLIGILYKGQKGELKKSHTDVHNTMKYLIDVEGFQKESINLLMDDDQHETPTRKNILNAFRNLAATSKCGDIIFLYYAGHGGQIEDDNGDEDDGYDETILPVDTIQSGPITDDEMFEHLVCPLKKGVTMTCIFDCSHSGTMLDLPFEFNALSNTQDGELIAKFSHLNVVKKIHEAQKDQEKLLKFWESVTTQASGNLRELVRVINEQAKTYAQANVCLFSACEDGTEASDLPNINGYFEVPDASGHPGGAFTTLFIETLNSQLHSNATIEGEINRLTNRELMVMLRFGLANKGLLQRPVLSTSRIDGIDQEFNIIPKNFTGRRRAVMIGIRYKKNSSDELKGTHNDVLKMIDYLKEKQGFVDEDFTILMDDKKHTKPIRLNIILAYIKLVKETQPGDAVFCFFSGHGGQLEDIENDEEDGFDETMIPLDVAKNGPIKDDLLFKKLVCPMPENVTMTCVFDCCNSGTILDLPFTFAHDESQYALIEKKPRIFPHMAYAKSLRENKD